MVGVSLSEPSLMSFYDILLVELFAVDLYKTSIEVSNVKILISNEVSEKLLCFRHAMKIQLRFVLYHNQLISRKIS